MVFPPSLHVVVMTLPRKRSGPRVWPWCDRQQTIAVVREGDLAEKKTSHGWMGCSLTKSLLLTTSVKQTWHGVATAQRNTFISVYSSLSPLIPLSFFVIFELRSIYQINLSYLFSSYSFAASLYFLPLSFLWHFSISAPINFSLMRDSMLSSVPFPVSQTPAKTNIVFNTLLLVMNPSVDLACTPCWQFNFQKECVHLSNWLAFHFCAIYKVYKITLSSLEKQTRITGCKWRREVDWKSRVGPWASLICIYW